MRSVNSIALFLILLFISTADIKSQILLNEFVASNSTGGYFDAYSRDNPDWIEIYNASDSLVNLEGYYLSDDPENRDKWKIPEGTTIPADGFALFLADGLDTLNHTNFKLSADGEAIVLSNASKEILDLYLFLPQATHISMGRLVEDTDVWVYFNSPTPNRKNSSVGFTGKARAPEFSEPGGFYEKAIMLEINSPNPMAILRYTLDGRVPTESSPIVDKALLIDSTTVVNVLAFEEGKMSSEMGTHTYFIGEEVSLPVLSFTMPPVRLDGFPPEFEKKYHVEYFDEQKEARLNQDVGVRITGLVGIHPMRSFSLYARNEYGDNRLNYRLFKEKPLTSYKNLVIRNGGYQDYSYTYLRDGLIQSFIKGNLDLEYQAYQPVVVYKNGSYLALMNMREKMNEFFVENNTGVDKDGIDLLEYQTEPPIQILNGDSLHFSSMMDFIEASDLSLKSNMDYLEKQMDVKNFLDYYILQIYCANADWPDKNSKIWRPRKPGGKWRWMVFDVDYGYGFAFPAEENMYEYLYNLEEPFYHNRPWVTVVFRKIMENEKIRNYYLQRFNVLLNTVFHPQRALHKVDSLKALIEPEMGRHIQHWGDKDYGIPSLDLWQGYCDTLDDFAARRPEFARNNMMDFYGIKDTVSIKMQTIGGSIFINDHHYCKDSARGVFFKDVPIEFRAEPNPGYEFVEWQNAPGLLFSSQSYTPESNLDIIAVFRPKFKHILSGTLNSDTILSDSLFPYISSGDLIIPANMELSMTEGVRLLMPEGSNIYVYGTLTIAGSQAKPVVIDSYSGIWGGICLNHGTGTSEMSHLVLKHASRGSDPELYPGAIAAYYTPISLSNVLIEDVPGNPVFTWYSNTRVKNCHFHSLGTCDLINVKYADTAIVEHSVFMDSRMPDTDAIDYDGVKYGIIRFNKIHNLVGENSDGIDIGEEAGNVQIYGNLITNCSDKGISIGQASSMEVYRNVIYQCNMGIAVKDFGSTANIYNNTLNRNSIGISCYEKNLGKGAGSAQVLNSIIAGSELASILKRNEGQISVSYSISDTEQLAGTGNLFDRPGMIAPYALNFELLPSSPCIDAGSPKSLRDEDGSVADMGAYFVSDWEDSNTDVIINEYFSASSADDPEDWIEIYNKGPEPINLSGWYVMDGDNQYFSLPANTHIDAFDYLVVCRDSNNFKGFFGADYNLAGNFGFSLGKSRDLIGLYNDSYVPVSSLSYDEDNLWPDSREKDKLSVALIDTSLIISEGQNWRTAYKMFGTPGYTNIPERISGLYLNEISGAVQSVYADGHGEYEDWIEIYNASEQDINLGGLYLSDDLKRPDRSRVRANIPDSTLIPAMGFYVFFADNEPWQGANHLDFKIGARGEELGLIQLVGLDTFLLDHLAFGELIPGLSLARHTDGGAPWERQSFTPGRSNLSVNVKTSDQTAISVYPNPTSDMLHIMMDSGWEGHSDIQMTNVLGQSVLRMSGTHLSSGKVLSIDLSSQASGIYFIRILTGDKAYLKRVIVIH